MNLRIFILMVAMSVLIYGCKKDTPAASANDAPSDFYMQGLKNNVAWTGYAKANTAGTDSVIVQGSGMFDVLQLKFKLNGAGQYTLSSSDATNLYWVYGEVIIRAKYALRNDVASTLTVTAYSATTKIVEGAFSLHLVKMSGSDTSLPQNVDFSNGAFRVQVVN